MTSAKKRILSGIQPSGDLNIGNYLGALRQWVALQHEYECFFCVVNLHALTVRQDPAELRTRTRQLAALYLACGIDPAHARLFIQSHVPEHSELSWLLSTFTMMGELEKMTQFKDKAKRHQSNVNAGLFTYPVLMAADILLYQAALVPIGEDQKQHLELARNIVKRMNGTFERPLFTMPDPYIPKAGARIKDLQHPDVKMSKSMPPAGTLPLLEEPSKLVKKIRRAVTDNEATIRFDPEKQPGVANLLTIIAVCNGKTPEACAEELEGRGYKELKEAAAEAVVGVVEPIQARYAEIMSAPEELEGLLRDGAEQARVVAAATLRQVHEALGVLPA